MLSDFPFWIWGTITAQLLTASLHSLSFIAPAKPRDEMEKQLVEIRQNINLIWEPGSNVDSIVYFIYRGEFLLHDQTDRQVSKGNKRSSNKTLY
jgi:hypothetical protein